MHQKYINFLNNNEDIINIFLSSLTIINLLIFLLYFIAFYFIFKIIIKVNYYNLIFISFNLSLFLFCITIFKSNIPFADAWREIYDLINNNTLTYLLMWTGGDHPFFGFKFFNLIIYKYFNLNYSFIHFVNFLIYFTSCLILLFYLSKFKNSYLLFISFTIFFSGKWFNIFFDPVNVSWTINFFLSILFIFLIDLKNNYFKYISIFFILFFATLNFGAGTVLLLFTITYFLFSKQKIFYKFFFLISVFFIFGFVYYLIPAYIKVNYDIIPKFSLDHLRQINFLSITSSYFGLNSIIYFTHIDINLFRQISVLIGFFQNILILSHVFFSRKEIFNKIQNLILKNPLLCIGITGSLLLAFARTNNFEQARYSQFSIFFQIGFVIFIYQNYKNNFLLYKKKFFLFLFLFIYSIFFFVPFSGIRFFIY